jgi:hypothetical protein
MNVYSQQTMRYAVGRRQIGRIYVRQDHRAPREILLPFGRWRDLSGGACQEANTELPFELLNCLRDTRPGKGKVMRGLREATALHHPHKDSHRVNSIHCSGIPYNPLRIISRNQVVQMEFLL